MGSHARGVPYYTRRVMALAQPDGADAAAAADAWQRSTVPERTRGFVYQDA